MPAVSRFQVGAKDESTTNYGEQVTVDRFWEFNSDSVMPEFGRVESSGMRNGALTMRNDRHVPYVKGCSGTVVFDVLSRGFGWWLKHLVGTTGTSGPNVDNIYTHTGTFGTFDGDSFNFQSNRPFHPGDTDKAFSFRGGKVAKWSFECKVDEPLVMSLDLDFQTYTTGTALASASYITNSHLLTFVGGQVTVAGTQFDVTECKIECDNGFDVERRFLRNNALKKEPKQSQYREITWELTADWDNVTQFTLVEAALASGNLAAIELVFTGPVPSGSTYPSLTIRIDEARFDEFDNAVSGPEPLVQKLTGKGLFDNSSSPVTLTYLSLDSTA